MAELCKIQLVMLPYSPTRKSIMKESAQNTHINILIKVIGKVLTTTNSSSSNNADNNME
jgi:hypothetical protein